MQVIALADESFLLLLFTLRSKAGLKTVNTVLIDILTILDKK